MLYFSASLIILAGKGPEQRYVQTRSENHYPFLSTLRVPNQYFVVEEAAGHELNGLSSHCRATPFHAARIFCRLRKCSFDPYQHYCATFPRSPRSLSTGNQPAPYPVPCPHVAIYNAIDSTEHRPSVKCSPDSKKFVVIIIIVPSVDDVFCFGHSNRRHPCGVRRLDVAATDGEIADFTCLLLLLPLLILLQLCGS